MSERWIELARSGKFSLHENNLSNDCVLYKESIVHAAERISFGSRMEAIIHLSALLEDIKIKDKKG